MIVGILSRAVLMSTPLLYGSIAEVYAERSGMMVTAIEGIFLIGAWAGFTGSYLTGSLLIGLIWAILGGLLLSALYGWITVFLRQHQVVTGTALNILAVGICAFFPNRLCQIGPLDPLRDRRRCAARRRRRCYRRFRFRFQRTDRVGIPLPSRFVI